MENNENDGRKRPISTKTGSAHLLLLPAMMKIANYLPMAKPDATNYLENRRGHGLATGPRAVFTEVDQLCPLRTG